MAASLSETRYTHCSSAPPTSSYSDLPPLPPILPADSGPDMADAWPMALRSHPVEWPSHSPSINTNSMVATGGGLDAQQNFGQVMGSLSQNLTQIGTYLAGMSRTSSPLPEAFGGPIINPIPQHGSMMNYLPQQSDRIGSSIPQDYSQTVSPSLQDFDQTINPFTNELNHTQHVGSTMDYLPQQGDRTGSSIPQDYSQIASPSLQNFGQRVPQGQHSIMSSIPQILPRTTSPLPTYWSATQASATSDFGITQNPIPHDANHSVDYFSKSSDSFASLIAA